MVRVYALASLFYGFNVYMDGHRPVEKFSKLPFIAGAPGLNERK